MNKKILLTFKKTTFATHVYENEEVGITFYIPKTVFGEVQMQFRPPAAVTVTIEAVQ